jgi:myo-inositol-1(or 4)-monophosphatase
MLGTGFPYDRRTSAENNLAQFVAFKRRVQAIRRFGSAALDLALVAAGRLDGYWEMKLKPWDLAAGLLICQEAGGTVTDWRGGAVELARGEVLASNGHLHQQLCDVLANVEHGQFVL